MPQSHKGSAVEVARAFFILGLTAFGGPVAHLGYFHDTFVKRRKWLSEAAYAEIVALCQFLPGPASSQVGMAIGLSRAGWRGMAAAWLAFTLPSALIMVLVAFGLDMLGGWSEGVIKGLKIATLAVVANAAWQMAGSLTPDTPRRLLAIAAAILILLVPNALTQIVVIAIAAGLGAMLLRSDGKTGDPPSIGVPKPVAIGCLAAFFALLIIVPPIAEAAGHPVLSIFDAFYRTGALVFGGGHVVLPLMQAETVGQGLVDRDTFLAGYGAAQAVPGPLFTFAAFLGASLEGGVSGWAGAALCLFAVFLPSFLLVPGVLPFWPSVKKHPKAQAALAGANAGVVGILFAALYDPVFTAAIVTPTDMAFALVAFAALTLLRVSAWGVAIAAAAVGALLV